MTPYNYPFADNAPDQLVRLLGDVKNNPSKTPEFTATQLSIVKAGLWPPAPLTCGGRA